MLRSLDAQAESALALAAFHPVDAGVAGWAVAAAANPLTLQMLTLQILTLQILALQILADRGPAC
jgi:hypothetical protein